MSKEFYYTPFKIHARVDHRQDDDNESGEGNMKRRYIGVVSSIALDTKFTRMDITSLRNFAKKASAGDGVPIFSDHNYFSEYPIGRSIRGWIKDNKEFWSEFFIRAGLKDGRTGTDTDDIIARIDDKLITDLSKGYTGGEWSCSECGEQFRGNWYKECANNHVLGETITKRGKVTHVTALVKNAVLHHFSPVGVGSNPDSKIKEQIRSQLSNRSDSENILQAICETKNLPFAELRSELLNPTKRSFIMLDGNGTPNGQDTPQGGNQGSGEPLSGLASMTIEDLQTRVDQLQTENDELKDKLALGDSDTFAAEIDDLNKELRDTKKERDDIKHLADQGKIALDIARREAESAYIDYQGTRIKDESDPKLAQIRSEIDACMIITQLHETRDTYRRLAREKRMSGRKSSDAEYTPATPGNRSSNTPPNNYALNISGIR